MRSLRKRIARVALGSVAALALICLIYVWTHPLVFNESFFSHAHCMKSAGLGLETYAMDHNGSFPFHTNGYADALLLARDYCSDAELTGPGYNKAVFERVRKTGENAPEEEFGRVYVQGLSTTNDPRIAILFDKVPSPGGDHSHLLRRLWAPLGREVYTVGDGMHFILESEWPKYAREQVELLVAAGLPRRVASDVYSEPREK